MKFAVTGGAGFVGNNIVKLLINKGHEVIVIDNLHTGKLKNLEGVLEKIKFYEIDIRDKNELEKILNDVDGIFHEAALTIVQESFVKQDEYFDVNVKGTENIFEIAKKYNIKVVFASSSSIYGDSKEVPINENSSKNPINPYGETKLQDEILAKKYSNQGVKIIGLRYFNIFGKGQTGSYAGVITKFLKNIELKKPLIIYGQGNQIRDFIHVKDIAEANFTIMTSDIGQGFFNIGTGKANSINELASIMIKISNHKEGISYLEPLNGDVKESKADTSLTIKTFNWNYLIDLKEGLKTLIENDI
jgi:UDP-glucose 4-epimerase